MALRLSIFKQTVKRGARVVWTLTGFAGCFFFDHYADRVQRAVVAFVFGRDSRGDRLIAFEAARRVEVFALFAGMQGETALGTLADRVGEILEQSSALGAAGDGAGSGHVEGARSESVLALGRRRFFEFFFCAAPRAGILVTALPILGVGQKVPPRNTYFFMNAVCSTPYATGGRPAIAPDVGSLSAFVASSTRVSFSR